MPNVRSVADMAATIAQNLHRIDRRKFDVIVGIPRSGMIPASILATSLQMPLATLEGYCAGIVHGRSGVPQKGPSARILLVDDSCNKGSAMTRAMGILRKRFGKHQLKITRLVVYGPYQLDRPEDHVDIVFETVKGPRIFAWNMWKHIRLDRWGFDFDGVLCRDPAKVENDDGPRYLDFLSGAEPLFLPQRPIGHIVTGRLEKYRAPTEAWLHRHGIEFASLTMMPYSTKAERMRAGNRGGWKAEQARALGVEFFIESCPKQAKAISAQASIPVWCTRTQSLAGA